MKEGYLYHLFRTQPNFLNFGFIQVHTVKRKNIFKIPLDIFKIMSYILFVYAKKLNNGE